MIAEDGTVYVSDADDKVWALSQNDCGGGQEVLSRPADVDNSSMVDLGDITAVAGDWLGQREITMDGYDGDLYLIGDVNRDLRVDLVDVAVVVGEWLREN